MPRRTPRESSGRPRTRVASKGAPRVSPRRLRRVSKRTVVHAPFAPVADQERMPTRGDARASRGATTRRGEGSAGVGSGRRSGAVRRDGSRRARGVVRGGGGGAREGERCAAWTRWLVRTLLASTYPGSPYERKYMALDLLNAVAETWDPSETEAVVAAATTNGSETGPDSDPDGLLARADALEASPYAPCLRAECTTSLLGAAVDSWDKLRLSAFALLTRHPAPLAGVETAEKLEARLRWALALLRSPRVRESDAAALLVRLLFRKYALDGGGTCGWRRNRRRRPRTSARKKEPGRRPRRRFSVRSDGRCDATRCEAARRDAKRRDAKRRARTPPGLAVDGALASASLIFFSFPSPFSKQPLLARRSGDSSKQFCNMC